MVVRREKVILDLEGNFESKALRDAAAIKLLKSQIDGLSGRAIRAKQPLRDTERGLDDVGNSAKRNGAEIDKMSGRVRILADAMAVFGPSLLPITTSAIPAIAGLSNEIGFAVLGAGTAVLAFHGMGEALKAMQAQALDPSAAHLEKLQREMIKLGPAGARFARELLAMQPLFDRMQQTARAGLFPGLADALQTISTRAPQVAELIATISTTMGDLAREGASSLASGRWDSFFTSLFTEARPALTDLGHALGAVTHGLAEMWQAFIPLSNDFGAGLVKMAQGFDHWATGLSGTEGFQHFIAYLHETGPQVLDFLGSLTMMIVNIGRAAAPLGGPVLRSLTAFADAISKIATSPLGTPIFTAIAALTIYNRTLQVTAALQARAFGPAAAGAMGRVGGNLTKVGSDLGIVYSTLATAGVRTTRESERMRGALGRLGVAGAKAGLGVGALTLATTGAADRIGATNTITLALAGSMFGPLGTGIGAAAGGFLDLTQASDRLHESLNRTATTLPELSALVADLKSQAKGFDSNASGGGFFSPGYWSDWGHSINSAFSGDWASKLSFGIFGQSGADQNAAKLKQTEAAAATAARQIGKLSNSQLQAALDAGTLSARQQQVARSLLATRNTAAETAGKFITLGKDVNNTKVSLSGWLRQQEAAAAALVRFGNNAQTAARRGLADGLIKELEKAGPAGALRMRQLANGTQAEIARANRAWALGQQAIKDYQHTVAGTPKSTATYLELHGETEAQAQIRQIKAALAGIPRSISTRYFVTQTTRINKPHVPLPGQSADGSTVPKGGAYQDVYPYLLAPGEEVISNRFGQADRYRPLLKAINATRLGPYTQSHLALAAGGTVGRPGHRPHQRLAFPSLD